MSTPTPASTSLRPAYILTGDLSPTIAIGQQATGSHHVFVPVRSGSISTFPDFSPALSGSEVILGGDWASVDPDGKHLRLDVRVVLKLDDSNEHIEIESDGLMKMTEAVRKVIAGATDATTTKFGDGWSRPRFKTSEKYKQLQDSIFVGNARLVVEEKGPKVQVHIFQVVGESGEA